MRGGFPYYNETLPFVRLHGQLSILRRLGFNQNLSELDAYTADMLIMVESVKMELLEKELKKAGG